MPKKWKIVWKNTTNNLKLNNIVKVKGEPKKNWQRTVVKNLGKYKLEENQTTDRKVKVWQYLDLIPQKVRKKVKRWFNCINKTLQK